MASAITTVLLDAGGTLVMPNFRRIAEEFLTDGVVVDLGTLASAELETRRAYERADFARSVEDPWLAFMGGFARAAGLTRLPTAAFERLRQYHDSTNLWEDVMPGVVEALDALGHQFRLGVVSNANGTVRKAFERLELARYFEVIVDSGEERIEKPDPRLFAIALERMGARAEETAYVGDMYRVDVVGALGAGLRPVLLDLHGIHAEKPCERIASLSDLAPLLLRDRG